ncbi:MAG: hypothetical protein EBZ48_07670 [Proteobacteria bacterium]|nr:hypothetical protein [Pseudomonadota bacterium]
MQTSYQTSLCGAVRAGRAFLGWSQSDLARQAGLSLPTITRMEGASVDPRHETVHKIFSVFRAAGLSVSVLDDGSVQMMFSPPAPVRVPLSNGHDRTASAS